MPQVFAAADIGSNTAHLLVASMMPNGLCRIANQSEWLSLGQIVSHESKVPSELVSRLQATLVGFVELSRSQGAEGIYVFATEAMRKASNHATVIAKIQSTVGVEIDIVTPEREAELGLKGALLDTKVSGPFTLAELGGGSMQVADCLNADIVADNSLPIGTGVLIDKSGLGQPATAVQVKELGSLIEKSLAQLAFDPSSKRLIASGGVARGLWRALHPDGDRTLHKRELEYLSWAVQRLNISKISARYSVKPKRAMTLYPGSLVFTMLMDKLNLTELTVSEYGVREGAVMEMSQGKIVPCAL